jgi:hypothetical protein
MLCAYTQMLGLALPRASAHRKSDKGARRPGTGHGGRTARGPEARLGPCGHLPVAVLEERFRCRGAGRHRGSLSRQVLQR